MEYEIFSFRFEPGGGHYGKKDAVWAEFIIDLESYSNPHGKPLFNLTVPLERDLNQTFGEQEQQATGHAVVILREVLRLLEEHSLDELRDLGEQATKASLLEIGTADDDQA